MLVEQTSMVEKPFNKDSLGTHLSKIDLAIRNMFWVGLGSGSGLECRKGHDRIVPTKSK